MMAPAFAQTQGQAAPAAEAPSYVEQVLAKKGDAAIDPVLGANYRIPALAHVGDGVVLACKSSWQKKSGRSRTGPTKMCTSQASNALAVR